MAKKKKAAGKKDWRSQPRKPVKYLRNQRFLINCTLGERTALEERAAMAGMSLSDFVVTTILGKRQVPPRDE